MEIRIQSIHFDADKKLLDFAKKKIQKLGIIYERIVDVEVYLKFENASSQIKEKQADLKVNLPGIILFASEHAPTFEEAIDKAVESLKRQLKKRKDKLKN